MSVSKLQIKLLSSSGELLNVVNASNGRLTVLRAFAPSQLEPYRRAIAGVPGPERITVTLDGNEFNPDLHLLIGFGENATSLPGTVSAHLAAAGVNENNIHGLLMSYGLTEVATTPFSKLSACQTQRVRLLAALQQNKQLVVLNNPFEPMASDWRENFAQLLLNYVRSTPNPVLVTSMTYRPECFINNELIQRVQVGENDQRTIGFGSAPSEYDDLIKQIRSDDPKRKSSKKVDALSDAVQKKQNQPSPPAATRTRSTNPNAPKKRSQPMSYGIGRLLKHRAVRKSALFATLAIVVLVGILKSRDQSGDSTTKLASNSNTIEKKQKPRLKLKSDSPARSPENNAAKLPTPPDPADKPPTPKLPPEPVVEKVKAKAPTRKRPPKKDKKSSPPEDSPYLLDMYRASIKQSVLASFDGTESARAANMQLSNMDSVKSDSGSGREKQANAFTNSLLSDLKKTDGSGEHLPDRSSPSPRSPRSPSSSRSAASSQSQDPADFKNMSKEERRALLREKFRLAIERAAANKR